jgi:hypothetical protein
MKLKGLHIAEIQESTTDEEEFSAPFQKIYDCAKSCVYVNGAYFELKKGMCLRFKKPVIKLLGRIVYIAKIFKVLQVAVYW